VSAWLVDFHTNILHSVSSPNLEKEK